MVRSDDQPIPTLEVEPKTALEVAMQRVWSPGNYLVEVCRHAKLVEPCLQLLRTCFA